VEQRVRSRGGGTGHRRTERSWRLAKAARAAEAREVLAEADELPRNTISDGRCTICQSPHRIRIERWRAQGMSAASIARRLHERYGEESISEYSIRRHCRSHVDMASLVASYYAVHRTETQGAASDGMSEIERIEQECIDLYHRAHDIGEELDALRDSGKSPSLAHTQLYLGCLEERRQRIKLLTELRGNQPADEVGRLLASLWGEQEELESRLPAQAEAAEGLR